MNNLSAIILAAGQGTRMKSSLPKVMHKVGQKPLIWHILHNITQTKIDDIVAVIGPDTDVLTNFLHAEFGQVQHVLQKERLGTAHAVLTGLEAVQHKQDNIAVLYGDTPFVKTSTIEKMNAMIEDDVAVVVLGFIAKNPGRYGRLIKNDQGELEKIVEFLDATDQEKGVNLCNSGMMLINGKHLDLLKKIDNKNAKEEYYLTDIVELAKKQNLRAKHFSVDETEVLGVNSRSEQVHAEMVMQKMLRRKFLEEGVTLVEPDTAHFSVDTKIGHDCIIHPNVVFGPGVILHSNVEVKSFSHLEGAEVKSHSVIGPFARLRPGANIGEKVKVGNFVEIKNSDLDKNSSVSHLTYIGDSKIGEGSNIGAGTITCNYDGYNKSKTIIGKNTFIGSNTALVAPVEVGDGAIVAAGSVITKNVERNSLVVARGEEKSYAGKADSIRKNAKAKADKLKSSGNRL
ncbi:MAG: bifunctional UDP-N-acetylglucosamine diphosphorylase/glucosamine-1-phosphate N-acetyltransferase GlmU [Rickettsiales bacterium]